MPNQEKKLTPEDKMEKRLAAKKAQIEAGTKKKIEMERRREIILRLINLVQRKKKLILIGIIVLLVVIIGGCSLSKLLKPKPEAPVIPTTPQPTVERPPEGFEIKVEDVQMVSTNGEYDLIAKIKNTDPNWGVSSLSYTFNLLDSQGNMVGERKGTTFILPLSKRSIIEVGLKTEKQALKAELKLDLLEVQKLKSIPDLGLSTSNPVYNLVENKTKGKVTGSVINKGPYSFETVYLNIVLFSREGKILGLNRTLVGNLLSGQERYFSAIWTKPSLVWVDKVEVEVLVDLFKSTAFIKDYGAGEPLEY